ncbi:DUF2189 domain-containing protein [Sinirhodobacter sp. WL0062]|uniref:DUF2189 domain-containing protein n=1 Tax=Rhodobacter flavimaris TaxID=2907145 RepID=A0ABS8Z2N3_9RHOB|nr:DUF2189 domain-containing protein [Sinirhodobacter sp. WL0062]MCE5975242.1 DUF2189 domain-containing protein [Sinirhodobacter sp. WL0062]
MTRATIGNPLSWSAARLADIGHGLEAAISGIGSHETALPKVNNIGMSDIRVALRKGAEDFAALRSDVIMLVLLYPVIGFALAAETLGGGQVHLLFPLIAGFPLVGPVTAVGLYEMSRRRELGETTDWRAALTALTGRVLGPVLTLGVLLVVIFLLWLIMAHAIWTATLGPVSYHSLSVFLHDTFMTDAGWTMILLGGGVGFVFAVVVLCISLVSFPMLIDRPVGVPVALATSLSVARRNPLTTAIWGVIVAVSLMLGAIPFFTGLIVVLPILGHATWHLYRRAVAYPA